MKIKTYWVHKPEPGIDHIEVVPKKDYEILLDITSEMAAEVERLRTALSLTAHQVVADPDDAQLEMPLE